jgi:FMN phosphatase YigB (HAD superfamily)
MRQQRNLLLCFDAFGTLFKPTRPIPEQYLTVARQYGLDGFGLDQLEASFKAAFKGELLAHPNYGKASGMGAEKWWTNVSQYTSILITVPRPT